MDFFMCRGNKTAARYVTKYCLNAMCEWTHVSLHTSTNLTLFNIRAQTAKRERAILRPGMGQYLMLDKRRSELQCLTRAKRGDSYK